MNELDLFFLSYDEPNAEEHWADLLNKAPWAQRIHGVKGFGAVHEMAAKLSETDRFITIDADNVVDQSFFEQNSAPAVSACLSYAARNTINGLQYGNGGIKIWNKEFVLNGGAGHEINDSSDTAIDFCWQDGYEHSSIVYSSVEFGSNYQAYRVGFREGVKLCMDRGRRVDPEKMIDLHPFNLRNLRMWSCVGSHTPFGDAAIFGTRAGWARMLDEGFDPTVVRDFDWFNDHWENEASKVDMRAAIDSLENKIMLATGIEIRYLEPSISRFFIEMK
jgi:hypothetical protein